MEDFYFSFRPQHERCIHNFVQEHVPDDLIHDGVDIMKYIFTHTKIPTNFHKIIESFINKRNKTQCTAIYEDTSCLYTQPLKSLEVSTTLDASTVKIYSLLLFFVISNYGKFDIFCPRKMIQYEGKTIEETIRIINAITSKTNIMIYPTEDHKVKEELPIKYKYTLKNIRSILPKRENSHTLNEQFKWKNVIKFYNFSVGSPFNSLKTLEKVFMM